MAWVKYFGPLGGGGGRHETAYIDLSNGDCRGVVQLVDSPSDEQETPLTEPLGWLYGAVGSACLAAFEGQTDLWTRAERDYDKARNNHIGYTCADLEVFRMLEELVRAHQAGVTQFAKGSGKSSCPRLVEVRPNHGPAGGGYEVEVIGENLPLNEFRFYWCDVPIQIQTSNGRSFRMKVPPYRVLHRAGCTIVLVDISDSIPVRPQASFEYDGV